MRTLYEYIGNLHSHTTYSDGTANHVEIAQAALQAGLDFVIVTDHNIRVAGVEGYYEGDEGRRVLLLVGEELHNPRREPQANHMLVYGVRDELAAFTGSPQNLLDEVEQRGGVAYLAHPVEFAAPAFGQDALPWVDWNIQGFTGIELWNYMSEFKSRLTGKLAALNYAFKPENAIRGPFPETLQVWDRLLAEGKRIKAIGSADAHGQRYAAGPLERTLFPYEYLFRCINTHILTSTPLVGDFEHDRQVVINALRDGTAFVGYDLPAPTTGFRFSAQGHKTEANMGEVLRLGHGVTLQIVCPQYGQLRLIRDGQVMLDEKEGTHRTYIASQPGAYRVEVYLNYRNEWRGWIFSNPIFITA